MRQIQLTQGKFAQVDDEDFERMNAFKWFASKLGNSFYAVRNITVNDKRKLRYMHQLIMGDTPVKSDIDHRDGNGCNNQRSNLRFCTHQKNQMNRRPQKNCTSIYKGVCWHKTNEKWVAHIRINGKLIYLGLFIIEKDAALAYDLKAKELFGEFARLNFP